MYLHQVFNGYFGVLEMNGILLHFGSKYKQFSQRPCKCQIEIMHYLNQPSGFELYSKYLKLRTRWC